MGLLVCRTSAGLQHITRVFLSSFNFFFGPPEFFSSFFFLAQVLPRLHKIRATQGNDISEEQIDMLHGTLVCMYSFDSVFV